MIYIKPIVVFLLSIGLLMICLGAILKVYPHKFRILLKKNTFILEEMVERKTLKHFLSFLSGKTVSKRYKLSQKIISKSETEMSVHVLYLLKVLSLLVATFFSILVSFTNADVIKLSVMSKTQESFQIFQEAGADDYSRNAALYKAVIGRIGEDVLKKLDESERLKKIKGVLPALMGTGEREVIEDKASAIVKTFDTISRIRPLSLQVFVIIILSYWLPELVLLVKRLLLGNRYRKEVIKLENIFELLGSIRNFKTINIIEEMAKSSKSYRKHLEKCIELFKTEKELALNVLKTSVRNNRFSKLVDILRVYSMTDKKLALQIMERCRLEKEEEILLTAEEDIDLVDLIAFISIIPILLQLANLLLKPMLDMIYEAFKFV